MKRILKWTYIALMTTTLMYCVQSVSGYKPSNDASADAGIIDAGVTQDASVVYVQCQPCIEKEVYTRTTDASGFAQFDVSNLNPNGEQIMNAWMDADGEGTWVKISLQLNDGMFEWNNSNFPDTDVKMVIIR